MDPESLQNEFQYRQFSLKYITICKVILSDKPSMGSSPLQLQAPVAVPYPSSLLVPSFHSELYQMKVVHLLVFDHKYGALPVLISLQV